MVERRRGEVSKGPTGVERVGGRKTTGGPPGGNPPSGPAGSNGPTASSAEGRARDERREAELLRDLAAKSSELEVAAALVAGFGQLERKRAGERKQSSLRDAGSAFDRSVAIAGTRANQQSVEHSHVAASLISGLAPGAANGQIAATKPTEPTACVRVGEIVLPAGFGNGDAVGLPLILPLLDSGSIVLSTSEPEGTTAAMGAVSSMVLRLLCSVPPTDLIVHQYDPRLRGTLSPLAQLRSLPVPLIGPAMTDERELELALEGLTHDVTRVSELLAGRYETLGALESEVGESGEPYRILVVSDYPAGIGERSASMIERLMERGASGGVSVILHHDSTATPAHGVDAAGVLRLGRLIEVGPGRSAKIAGIEKLRVTVDAAPDPGILDTTVAELSAQARSGASPALPLDDLLADFAGRDDELEGRLLVPIGKAGLRPVTFTLGDNFQQLHNALVGGAVGQGKSNVLLVIIHALAALYRPDQLEFLLLDFKEGLEFSSLAPGRDGESGLPHASVLGLESDRQFGVAVLRHVRREFDRRASAFKGAAASNLGDYCRSTGEVMARWVVVLDEFQVLFESSDAVADEAIELLETLARKGRAYGIHLILASQTLSGIQPLIAKEDSIFSQFPIRIALKTTPSESQVLLQIHNDAAAQLRFRGEAILNTESGQVAANQRIRVAYADPERCRDLRTRLSGTFPGKRPFVFVGGQPTDPIPMLEKLGPTPQPSVVLGMPVAVSTAPASFILGDEPGRHLAIIGAGSDPEPSDGLPLGHEAIASLQSAVVSLARSSPEGSRFTFLNSLSSEQSAAALLPDLAMSVQMLGHDVAIVEGDGVAEEIVRIAGSLESRRSGGDRHFVIGWGLHRAIGLDRPDPISAERPVDALQTIVKDGPVTGLHLVGWWNSYKAYEQQIEMGFSTAGIVQGFAFSRAPQQDVASVAGPFAEWRPAPNRLLVLDRTRGDNGLVAVPSALLGANDLRSLAVRS